MVTVADEAALQRAIQNLASDTTIVIGPGTYVLTRTLSIRGPLQNVAIRGATGNSGDVVLIGPGMTRPEFGSTPFGIWTGGGVDGVLIANLTIRELFYHPIIFNAGTRRPHLYNVHLIDAGEQFIKVNPDDAGAGVSDGILEYSVIEFTSAARDTYPKGIDVHGGENRIIRHNLFRNLVGPAGAVAGPGVLMWRGSRNTLVEGNTFLNCSRGIMFGADDLVTPSHRGGVIRNNVFYRSASQPGDVGIMLADSPDTQVLNNTVIVSGTYPRPLEYRFAGTRNVLFANNLADGPIEVRDGATGTLTANILNAAPETFVDAVGGDLHLAASAVTALDRGIATEAAEDWDGDPRPQGLGYDVGADERVPSMDRGTVPAELRPRTSAATRLDSGCHLSGHAGRTGSDR